MSSSSSSSWADLLPELLQSILSRLFGKDVPVFRAVCRQWNSIPSPVHDIAKHPLLLRYRPDNNCELYSPAYGKTYFVHAHPWLRDTQIHSFNHGWLLLSRCRKFFFLRPTTGEIIRLPKSNSALTFNVMSFSAPPTSPNCEVIRVTDVNSLVVKEKPDYSRMYIDFTRRGDSTWIDYNSNLDDENLSFGYLNKARMEFYPRRLVASNINANRFKLRLACKANFRWSASRTAPVFHKGAFYCLGQEGRLGVFNPRKKNFIDWWNVIDVKCRAAFNTNEFQRLISGQTPALWKDPGEGDFIDNDIVDPSDHIRDLGISCRSRCKTLSSSGSQKMIITEQKRPWIILSHTKKNRGTCRMFVDLINRAFHTRDKMEASLMSKQVYGVSSEKVALVDVNSGEWALLDTSSMAMDALPMWKIPKGFIKRCCVIHLPPGDSRFIITVFGHVYVPDETPRYRFIRMYCRVGDKEWTTRMEGRIFRMSSAVAYRGKIYGCANWGCLYEIQIQPEGNEVQEKKLANLPQYEPMGWRAASTYLVESCGELFLFTKFMSEKGDDFEVIMEARAYRLDEKTERWEELQDLGDMAFFGGIRSSGFVCSASGFGLPRNSLYFVDKSSCKIIRYDYENRSICTFLSCRDEVEDCSVDELVMF
ncbi:F-box/kelch-repeat protein At3g18720 [Linum grandiflorum]